MSGVQRQRKRHSFKNVLLPWARHFLRPATTSLTARRQPPFHTVSKAVFRIVIAEETRATKSHISFSLEWARTWTSNFFMPDTRLRVQRSLTLSPLMRVFPRAEMRDDIRFILFPPLDMFERKSRIKKWCNPLGTNKKYKEINLNRCDWSVIIWLYAQF